MYLRLVLLVVGILIVSTSAAVERADQDFQIDAAYAKNKIHPKIESNLLKEKSGAFAAQIQSESTIQVVFELKDSDKSYIRSLEDNGAVVEAVHKNLVQASVPASKLKVMSEMPFVDYVRSPMRPYKDGVVSEGVGVINASKLHSLGFDGSGVKIAVLDLGFANYSSKLGIELPDIVTVRSFSRNGIEADGEIHGTAVAEIVYDIAPNASMYFINFDTDINFSAAVDYAISQDVDIISMSVGWLPGPYDGTGFIDDIVNNATTKGIVWVNSAGNYAQKHWEGRYKEITITVGTETWPVHDFGGGDKTNSFYALEGDTIEAILSWNNWPRSNQDYDLLLVNDTDIVWGSGNTQNGTQEPYEAFSYKVPKSEQYGIIILKYSATQPVDFDLYLMSDHSLEYKVAESSLSLPADSRDVIAVGATYWSNDTLESFSSQGPTNDGRIKPDVVAPDGVLTSTSNPYRFFGTSASAPHVTGAAGLLLQLNQSLSANQLKQAMENGAKDLGTAGKDNKYGAGRIDVYGAYLQIVPPVITFSSLTPENNNVTSLNWVYVNISSDELLNTALLEWNGLNESMLGSGSNWYKNKTSLSDGVYYFRVWGRNYGGKWNVSEKRNVTLDLTPPIVIITSPTNNSFVNHPNVTIRGNATDNFRITTGCIEHISVGGGSSGCGGPINNKSINFSHNITLQEGKNFIKVTYIDGANNSGSASVNVTLDTIPPVFNSVFLNDSMMKMGDSFYLEVNATDDLSESLNITMHVINESGVEVHNKTLGKFASGLYRLNGTVDMKLPEGNLTLNISATDKAGNTAYNDSREITIDKTKPAVTNLSLSVLTPGINYPVNITLDVKDIHLNISSIFVEVKHPDSYLNRSSMEGNGPYYCNYTNTSKFGRYNVTINASDRAGNINSTEKTWFVTKIITNKSYSSNITIRANDRGEIATGTKIWDKTNFLGLVINETLSVQNVSGRIIPKGELLYNTSMQSVKYKVNEFNSSMNVDFGLDGGCCYAKMGWQGITYVAINGKVDKITSFLFEQSAIESKTLTLSGTGSIVNDLTWSLKEGYNLSIEEINVSSSPKWVKINLTNASGEVNTSIISMNDTYSYYNSSNKLVLNATVDYIYNGTSWKLVILNHIYQISEINGTVLLNDEKRMFKSGIFNLSKWSLPENYYLTLLDIDWRAYPRQAWFEFGKGNMKLDDKVIQAEGGHYPCPICGVYTQTADDLAGENNVPIFVTYAENISATSVRLKYTWLISDNVTVIRSGETYGLFKDAAVTPGMLSLRNSDTSINLSHDAIINLMDDLYFRVTNNASLEYYPFFSSIAPTRVNATETMDMDIEIFTNRSMTDNIRISRMADIPPGMNRSFTLTPFGKYIEIASENLKNNLSWIKLRFYYTKAELDASGLDENSLKVSWYNDSGDRWQILNAGSPDWVYGTGVDTADTGGYAGSVWVNLSHLSTFGLVGSYPTTGGGGNPPSSSSGGGGGGGGGASGENYSNIILKEKYDEAIYKDKPTSYKFKNASNPVMFINITGNFNSGLINTAVEVLKGTSTLVKEDAPGIVNRNFNIWVGTSGFSTSKNIKEATVMFRVENSWIEGNALARSEIKLVKWDNGTWKILETSEKNRDGTYTYFEGKTTSFSPFAVTGIKEAAPTAALSGLTASPTATTTAVPSEVAQPGNLAIILVVIVLIAVIGMSVAVYMKRK